MKQVVILLLGVLPLAQASSAAEIPLIAKQFKAANCSLKNTDQFKLRMDLASDVLHFGIEPGSADHNLSSTPKVEPLSHWPQSGIQGSLHPETAQNSAIERKWANRKGHLVEAGIGRRLVNAATHLLDKEFIAEMYESVFVTADLEYAVTYSNYGITRIFDARSDALLSEIPYGGPAFGKMEGVLAVSDRHLILAQAMAKDPANPNTKYSSFLTVRPLSDPTQVIYRYDFGNAEIKGIHFTGDDSKMIVTTNLNVSIIEFKARYIKTYFVGDYGERISTSRLLNDHQILLGYEKSQDERGSVIRMLDFKANLVSPWERIAGVHDSIIALGNPNGDKVDVVSVDDVNTSSPKITVAVDLPIPSRQIYDTGYNY